jgi:hypothetical protein
MSLTGCFSDQQKQFFQCRLEAIKAYPDDDGIFGKRSEYIQTCMGTAGTKSQVASKTAALLLPGVIPTPAD